MNKEEKATLVSSQEIELDDLNAFVSHILGMLHGHIADRIQGTFLFHKEKWSYQAYTVGYASGNPTIRFDLRKV